jgi:2',3'-cyclic-nucleotide 2'-phosphodiesterase (5'-nucleotidase family)
MRELMQLLKPIYNIFFLSLLIGCSPAISPSGTGQFIAVTEKTNVHSAINEFIQPYKDKMEAEMNVILGHTVEELTKEGKGESKLGNLITDFQKRFAEDQFGYTIDISIMNNGGIRSNLPKGSITLGAIYEISPFDNYLQILEIPSEAILELVNYAAKGKNLGIAGLTYTVSDDKIQEILIDGQPIVPGRTYRLAANDYIAGGGDNMHFLIPLKRIEETSIVLRDILITEISKENAMGNPIQAKIEGRQLIQ